MHIILQLGMAWQFSWILELILGKITPFGLIAIAQVIMITLVGVLWFKIPMRGNLVLLFSSTLIYLLTSLGIGLLISTVSSTQQEAMMSVSGTL